MSEISLILVLPTNKISDMTKVAIKKENITSFGGINHIMDVFSKLGFEKLTESVLGKRGSSGKAFCYGSINKGVSSNKIESTPLFFTLFIRVLLLRYYFIYTFLAVPSAYLKMLIPLTGAVRRKPSMV